MGIYDQLLMAIRGQNGGAQGFMQPGNGAPQPTNMAPSLSPLARTQTGAGAMPQMPMGQPNMPAGASAMPGGGGGMFSQLQNNPMLMKMLMGGGQPGAGGMAPTAPAAFGQGTAPFNGNVPLPSQAGAYNVPTQQSSGIMDFLRSLMGNAGNA